MIAKLGIGERVIAIALVDDSLLAEAYPDAKLLAYPSLSEAFGLPPLEAMYVGCPVLACNASSLPELCGDTPFCYQKDDPESLRDALLPAVTDDSSRASAIELGREVASHYSSGKKCRTDSRRLR